MEEKLSFVEYLHSMLEAEDVERIFDARSNGIPIIVSGVEDSGKTTFVNLMRDHGFYLTYEENEPLRLTFDKPLEKPVGNFAENVKA